VGVFRDLGDDQVEDAQYQVEELLELESLEEPLGELVYGLPVAEELRAVRLDDGQTSTRTLPA
jgi:hypothetical protein